MPEFSPKIVQELKNINVDRGDNTLKTYSEILDKIKPIIEEIKQGTIDFNETSTLKLVTNRPIYFPGFLESTEKEVVCVLQTGNHGLLALVETRKGNYVCYQVEMDQAGVLQKVPDSVIPGKDNKHFKGLALSLVKQAVSKYENYDENIAQTISPAEEAELDKELKQDLTEQVEAIKSEITVQIQPQIEQANLHGYFESEREKIEEDLKNETIREIKYTESNVSNLQSDIDETQKEFGIFQNWLNKTPVELFVSSYIDTDNLSMLLADLPDRILANKILRKCKQQQIENDNSITKYFKDIQSIFNSVIFGANNLDNSHTDPLTVSAIAEYTKIIQEKERLLERILNNRIELTESQNKLLEYQDSLSNTRELSIKSAKRNFENNGVAKFINSVIFKNINTSLNLPDSLKISAKKIKIPNQNTFDLYEYSRLKSFGGNVEVNKVTGDIILEFPANNKQIFEKVEIVEQNKKYVKLKVTERAVNGTDTESYFLEYGEDVTVDDKRCLNIICESGSVVPIVFGDARKISWREMTRKPVIYIRDFKTETDLDITIKYNGEYEVVYPKCNSQVENTLVWNATTLPDNFIQVSDKKYPYLFWDGLSNYLQGKKFEQGFCIAGHEVVEFLEEKCTLFGFDEQLTTDFVTFWSPYMMKNPYNLIRWLSEKECTELAELNIECSEKLQIIRMYMAFQPVDDMIFISEQKLEKIELINCPKIFDWGGFQVS